MAEEFGVLLRRYRTAAGVSIAELARRIAYSKGQISKVENGARPSEMFAKQCDGALDAGGALVAAGRRARPTPLAAGPPAEDDEVWVMELDSDGDVRLNQLSRRSALAGAGALLGASLLSTTRSRPEVDDTTLAALRSSFDQLRILGRLTSPRSVLAPLIGEVHTLRVLAGADRGPLRPDLLRLASRAAEYMGWITQEAGDERAALDWTARAVTLAAAGADHELAAYALVRRAELAMYRHDPVGTIELTTAAQLDAAAGPRVRGLAAQFEAHGHALAGDLSAYQRALDRAVPLLAVAEPGPGPGLGMTTAPDQLALAAGWSLYDLGRPAEAAAVLDPQLARFEPTARRARTRFGVRCALAYAVNGDLDRADVLLRGLLTDIRSVDSATIRADLRELGRMLARWHTDAIARELRTELLPLLATR